MFAGGRDDRRYGRAVPRWDEEDLHLPLRPIHVRRAGICLGRLALSQRCEPDGRTVEFQVNKAVPISGGQLLKGRSTESENAATDRSGEERRQMLIGANAHLIIATLLRQGPKPGPLARTLQVTEVGRNVFHEHVVEYRSRDRSHRQALT